VARLSNKSAIVTGGGAGIGEATCMRFAEEGAEVAIFDLHPDVGQQVVAKIESKGGRAAFFTVDVSDETQVQLGVKSALDRFGKIDILINNAGITGTNRLTHETTVEDWDKIFAVNVRGTFLCTKHTLGSMMNSRRGSIVNLSSIYGLIGNADVPPYHATKGALLTMTKTDAVCYAPYGIRVNAVHPGTTLTPLVRQVGAQYRGGLEAYIKMMKEKHPLCLGEPVDVANAILFLASDEARFITGASLVIDGGYTAQ
jgi:NAD(P)-dependent dehydrogenase (short-subunit alcohol dehydrogenase family)